MSSTILITGASSGLGEGMAREFAARGNNLALCARRTERLDALKTELVASHPDLTVSVRALDVDNHSQVFDVFRAFRDDFGTIDRIIVNAGVGMGRPLGTGQFDANRQTAETNFVSALAQMEAAMEIFRAQNHGHLVTVSSVSAVRGMPSNITTYGATKAGLAALSEGLRVELTRTKSPIRVTTLYPGYINTAINEKVKNKPFAVDVRTGCKAMVNAIESGKKESYVPRWPWTPIGFLLKRLPVPVLAKMF
ncbi:SDR family oxidoreductase [Marinobacter sp. chi1]|uniref:SDR family oxidoreductase n=1 Tax=Marinobacter suaedae TaxID=3057675 RepID=A0ABT8VZP6_9GAMM|nr:SDR family oxidoreductase [Marinobacter sp. chi1]MDO3721473.1 SDR family oxidoreductase [Marinobacter sp. chi1]